MKTRLTKDQFFDIVKERRFGEKMEQALYMVLVQGYLYKDAAKEAGVSSIQQLGRNCRKVKSVYFERYEPEGWLTETLVYPPDLKSEVDALKAKIEIRKQKHV